MIHIGSGRARFQLTSSTPILTSPSSRAGSSPSATTRAQIRPTVSQSTRENRGKRGLVGLGRQERHQVLASRG